MSCSSSIVEVVQLEAGIISASGRKNFTIVKQYTIYNKKKIKGQTVVLRRVISVEGINANTHSKLTALLLKE